MSGEEVEADEFDRVLSVHTGPDRQGQDQSGRRAGQQALRGGCPPVCTGDQGSLWAGPDRPVPFCTRQDVLQGYRRSVLVSIVGEDLCSKGFGHFYVASANTKNVISIDAWFY